ncbi:MAG: DUF1207 domain-containing protein [Thermodesulfobacteriota bacterium]
MDAGRKAEDPPYTAAVTSGWRLRFGPGDRLYETYIANPMRPVFAFNSISVKDSDLPDAGDRRFLLKLGGRKGFLRLHRAGRPDSGFQFDLQAAFLGMFDRENSLDNIGWSGLYGAQVNWANGSGLAFKLALEHDSSHVGDEYIERTGRKRINYTRQEYVFGASFHHFTYWRIYGDVGRAFDLRNPAVQEKWRARGGVEFEADELFWNDSAGFYAAVDFNAYEESDWDADVTAQAGLVVPIETLGHTYRIGLHYRDGRSVIGEFSQFNETYYGIGFWLEI